MKKTRIIIAMLAILVLVLPFSLMACKKDTSDTGAITWATILNTDYNAVARDKEFSQVDEITIPLIDPVKNYIVVTDPAMYELDIALFYENVASINSFVVYNYKDNTSAAYNYTEAFNPANMDIKLTKDNLVVINNDVTDVNVIINSAGTQIIKTNSEITYVDALNLFEIDGDYFFVKDGTIKRLGVDFDNNNIRDKAFNNGYAQIAGNNYAQIYASTGELILSYTRPNNISQSRFNLLSNGDILIVNAIEVEEPTYRDLNESEYDYKVVDDQGDATYQKTEYLYMSAANKSITTVSYSFFPYFYLGTDMIKAMTNTSMKDGYNGIFIGLKPNGKIISQGFDSAAYYALKTDGTMIEIQDLTAAKYEGVRLVATDVFACIIDEYTALYNAKGEFINSFHTPDQAKVGSCYVWLPNKVVYTFDGTPKYEFEPTDVVLDTGDNYLIIKSGDSLKILYKGNNIATIDITGYNTFCSGIILLEKDGTTTAYKVDGTQIKSVNATFAQNNMYVFASGVICLGSDGKYYSVK